MPSFVPDLPLPSLKTESQLDALLNQFTHFGVELGLERIERLLAGLGNPERQVPVLHVAGSNGKGSVCAYLSSVLQTTGYRVGRYTSPHLVSWCERIWLDGKDIDPTVFHDLLQSVIAAISPAHPSPTQFEVVTAAAWLYFAQQQVDIAVMEVGLGGRLDATNVCDRPLVSVITSLSREHWQRLGPTLADITREKAGILKQGCPAAIAPQPPEAEAVLQQHLTGLACPVVWVPPALDLGDGWAVEAGNDFPLKYKLPLPGAHQLTNSAVAIAALRLLRQQGWEIPDKAITEGIACAQWKGRLQWITWRGRSLLIDGAHNPAGAAALRQYADTSDRITLPVSWVMGMIGTKDHADVFQELLRPGDRLYLVPVPDHLPVDLNYLKQLALQTCPELAECEVFPDVLEGLEMAFERSPHTTTVLCGSLYLIGHFFQKEPI